MLDLITVRPNFTRPACRAAAAAIDRYPLPGPRRPTSPASALATAAAVDRRDSETDTRPLLRACITYYESGVNRRPASL